MDGLDGLDGLDGTDGAAGAGDVVAVVGELVLPAAPGDDAVAERLRGALAAAAAEVGALLPALAGPTAGEGLRGAWPTLGEAALAGLLVRLAVLDAGGDLRVGLGRGTGGPTGDGDVDATAWAAARRGERTAERLARSPRSRTARTWWVDRASGGPGAAAEDGDPGAAAANAFLTVRDEVVAGMTPRARRLLAGLLRGVPQAEAAAAEGISQPAVSQGIAASGAGALARAHALLGAPRLGAPRERGGQRPR